MSGPEDRPARKVGYKQPPVETQFKKGQSGNPKGRAKGRKSLRQLILEELDTKVPVVKDGKRRMLTTGQIMVKKLVRNAASGDLKAFQTLGRICPDAFEFGQPDDAQDDATDFAIIKSFFDRQGGGGQHDV